ncbi:hypothetical protein ARMSODRAFT_462436 [Armillaria solidipes]|uniref:Uncharacterized protein n=1 Tax=Armillaria solidipes TaxID=1076256 RepID=A0A2H3BBQ6_9AGAR|nr:hypothetical protein ARMSODRAFT_462436 [Armillaria solidipes]
MSVFRVPRYVGERNVNHRESLVFDALKSRACIGVTAAACITIKSDSKVQTQDCTSIMNYQMALPGAVIHSVQQHYVD